MANWWEDDPVATGAASASAANWWESDPVSPRAQAKADVRAGNAPDYRQPSLLGPGFDRLSDQLADPFGVSDEITGAGQFIRKLVTSGGDLDEAGQAYSDAAERVRSERDVAREENTIVPEIVGGFGTTGIGKAVAAAPSFTQGLWQSAKGGAGFGAAAGAAQSEGGIPERLRGAAQGGAVGAVAAPLIGNIAIPAAARTIGGLKSAGQFANRAIKQARNPQQAAYESVADEMVKSGITPDQVRKSVAPTLSGQLQKRNFSEDDLAAMISRSLKGETHKALAKDYGLDEKTVSRYVNLYEQANPTPRNIVDVAKEVKNSGGAQPISNLMRSTMAISDDPVAAQRLIERQVAQPGRVANIIQKSGTRNFEDELERLATTARQEASAAYDTARKQAQPVNIRPVIRKWRGRRVQEGGEINNTVNKAVDMFFRGGMAEGPGKSLRYRRAVDVVDDVPTFLERRRELDQLISRSMQDGRPTPLTRELTQLRTDLNNAARRNNQLLKDADERFAENRTIEKILQEGVSLGKRLTPKSREAIREFRKMTPTQQEIFRVGFERRMADDALNVRRGAAAANQFSGKSFQNLVEGLYPPPASGAKGAELAVQKEVYKRGQDLLRNLRREAISTETARDALAGSRTAALGDDMAEQMEFARAAADATTGRFQSLLENLSNRLTRQIGQRAAQEKVRILTETDPAELLNVLTRLAQAAKTSGERRQYVAAIRQLRAQGIPGVSAVSGQGAGRESAERPTSR